MKNSIDLGRLPVHSDIAVQCKLFAGFIASVIVSGINKVKTEKELYRKYTMKEMLRILAKLWIQEINEQSIVAPLAKEQRMILSIRYLPARVLVVINFDGILGE